MAIRLIAVKCPECGAQLKIESGRKKLFCSYCGTQILVDNDNEYTINENIRHIDEAEIKKAEASVRKTEAERTIQLKKLEIIENKRKSFERTKRFKIILSIVLAIIGSILIAIGTEADSILAGIGMFALLAIAYIWMFSNNKDDTDIDLGYKVRTPELGNYEHMYFTSVEDMFRNAGFSNIKTIPLNDIKFGIINKPGMVESITVNGQVATSGKKVAPDSSVVISYHSR